MYLSTHSKVPYAWQLLFAALCIALLLDTDRQNKGARQFDGRKFPEEFDGSSVHQFECAIGRTKWRFYRVVRSFLFVLAFGYMATLFGFDLVARGAFGTGPGANPLSSSAVPCVLLALCGVMLSAAIYLTCLAARHFWNDYHSFGRCMRNAASHSVPRAEALPPSLPGVEAPDVASTIPPSSLRLGDQLSLGRAPPDYGNVLPAARESHRQLRVLAILTATLASAFTGLLLGDAVVASDWQGSPSFHASARLTLMALRSPQLTSGVSPATPAVLCMACVYLWAAGRMARLLLAHSVSRVSPRETVQTRLVSTPLRHILHPRHSDQNRVDEGFGDVECTALDAIWRPITGPYYVAAACISAFFPVLLFRLLKPFSTLESDWGTWFLAGGLALSVFLIGVTLVQLFQYWRALKKLLKRILAHPIGFAFHDIPNFARDSVDHQVSRTPDDALRWSTCALSFCDLVRASSAIANLPLLQRLGAKLAEHSKALRKARTAALRGREVEPSGDDFVPLSSVSPVRPVTEHEQAWRTRLEAELAEAVICAAAALTRMLEEAWRASGVQAIEVEPAVLELARERQLRSSGHAEIAPQRLAAAAGGGRGQVIEDFAEPHDPQSVEAVRARVPFASSFAPQSGLARTLRRSKVCDALSPAASAYTPEQLAWMRDAQRLVATVVTLLLHRHVRQFRYFLHVTTGCALLLLLAVASYPFEPYRLLITFIWVVMATVVGLGLWVFGQLDRNTLMSHISGSSPDRLTLDGAFLKRFIAWALVPMLSVAAAQYPELSNLLGNLIAPLTRGLQ